MVGVSVTKILLVLMATLVLGKVLFDSGDAAGGTPGVFTVVLLVLAGLVVYFIRNMISGVSFGEGDGEAGAVDASGESVLRPGARALRVIHHEPTWSVVAKGRSLGVFKNTPIPAWIRTSDQREADYCGVSNVPLPEKCTCIEIPERSELIVPPGLIYTVRS